MASHEKQLRALSTEKVALDTQLTETKAKVTESEKKMT